MEGLNLEKQPYSHYPIEKIKSAESPLLTKKQIQKLREYIEEVKYNSKNNPHWEFIDPNELKVEDLYAYKKVILEKSDKWLMAKDHDLVKSEFGNYEEIINDYLKETYKTDYKSMYKDSRSNIRAYLRSYLSGKSKTIH